MPGIDDLLRTEGESWRAEIDTHLETSGTSGTGGTGGTGAATRRSPQRPWSSARGRVWTASAAAVAAAAVIVLAVGLGTGSDGSSSSSGIDAETGPAVAGAAAGAGGSGFDSAASSVRGAGNGVSPASASSAASTGTAPSSSALILTGSIEVTVRTDDDVDLAATRATGIADGAGGRVDADSRTATTEHSATLVLRVPNAALPGVTRQLAALGTVRSQDMQTKDVTTQVADVDSRVTSARAAIAGLTRLYARARSVGELIAVESALAARQSDLEALEAQQRTLAAQTGLATVTLTVDVQSPAARHHAQHSGFVGGLHSGWHAFTRSLDAVATGLGAALPFAAVVLVLAASGLIAARRRRRPVPDS